jgi:xanthine dehydrogenase large subunit
MTISATGSTVHEPRRHDSADKQVSGAAVYADDVREPRDLLHCHIALSAKARARVRSVDLAAVRTAPGVVTVISADDIPGENNTGPVVHDEPMLAVSEASGGEVHYAGQALFVVAAETIEQARANPDPDHCRGDGGGEPVAGAVSDGAQ